MSDSSKRAGALEALARRIQKGGIDAVVIASVTGRTAVTAARALEGTGCRLICVADTPDWEGRPYPTLEPGRHQELLDRGVQLLRDYRSSSAGMPRFDPETGSGLARPRKPGFSGPASLSSAAGDEGRGEVGRPAQRTTRYCSRESVWQRWAVAPGGRSPWCWTRWATRRSSPAPPGTPLRARDPLDPGSALTPAEKGAHDKALAGEAGDG